MRLALRRLRVHSLTGQYKFYKQINCDKIVKEVVQYLLVPSSMLLYSLTYFVTISLWGRKIMEKYKREGETAEKAIDL